jgi:hypothetical protein
MRLPLILALLAATACGKRAPPGPAPGDVPPVDAMVDVMAVPACMEGTYSCGDAALLRCTEGGVRVVDTCRGPAGCVADGASCDDTLAEEDDVCDTPNQPACRMDRNAELRCEDGGFRRSRDCVSPCETLDAAIRCP